MKIFYIYSASLILTLFIIKFNVICSPVIVDSMLVTGIRGYESEDSLSWNKKYDETRQYNDIGLLIKNIKKGNIGKRFNCNLSYRRYIR